MSREQVIKLDGKVSKEASRRGTTLYEKLTRRAQLFKDEEERDHYLERARHYLKDYPMLNLSSDLDDLHAMLVELITQRRLLIKSNELKMPPGEEYSDSVKRWSQIKESLAGRRIDRKKMPEKNENIQSEILRLFETDSKTYEGEDKEMKAEEEEFSKEKEQRDKKMGLID